MRPLTLVIALAAGLVAAAPARAARPVVVAQVAGASAVTARQTTDRAAAALASTGAARATKQASKLALAAAYDRQLAEIDRLKRGRASWRRDRQVASKKAEAQATARSLASADAELRALDAALVAGRRTLLAAVNAELAVASDSSRLARLRRMRTDLRQAMRPKARKIILPDEALDRLADPEELAEQIALLERAEGELRREQNLLVAREDRYSRMARLRAHRERAAELSDPDEEAVRRSPGQASRNNSGAEASPGSLDDGAGAGGASSGDSSGGGGSSPPRDPGFSADDGGFESSSIALADVVDAATADALRRAGRSADPTTRAKAAAQARKQVAARLERLARSRLLIQKHLRKLEAE